MRTRRAVLTPVALWAASCDCSGDPALGGCIEVVQGVSAALPSAAGYPIRRGRRDRQAFQPRRSSRVGRTRTPAVFAYLPKIVQQWKPDASLEEISKVWHRLGYREVEFIDGELAKADREKGEHIH